MKCPSQYSNKAFQSAFEKGFAAYSAGHAKNENPYGDARTHYGGITFARGFWRAWNSGWEEAQKLCHGTG